HKPDTTGKDRAHREGRVAEGACGTVKRTAFRRWARPKCAVGGHSLVKRTAVAGADSMPTVRRDSVPGHSVDRDRDTQAMVARSGPGPLRRSGAAARRDRWR